nr:LCP family protein [Candidatus Gracilibacteria bacterium]
MNFSQRRIGTINPSPTLELKAPRKSPWKELIKKQRQLKKSKTWYKWGLWINIFIVILASTFVVSAIHRVYNYSSDHQFFSKIFNSVLSDFQKDENGYLNCLLIGYGGEGHDGAYLTDSMMVASIDTKNQNVVMLSIPRDLWVFTKQFGGSRINEI